MFRLVLEYDVAPAYLCISSEHPIIKDVYQNSEFPAVTGTATGQLAQAWTPCIL